MSQQERRYITSKEYQKTVIPAAGLVLIEKDGISEHYGDILLTKATVQRTLQHAATGIIAAISPFRAESEQDNYLCSIYKVGDRVGVNSTTPLIAPAPPYWYFKNNDDTQDGHYLIHIADLLGVICETDEEKQEFLKRIASARVNHGN